MEIVSPGRMPKLALSVRSVWPLRETLAPVEATVRAAMARVLKIRAHHSHRSNRWGGIDKSVEAATGVSGAASAGCVGLFVRAFLRFFGCLGQIFDDLLSVGARVS